EIHDVRIGRPALGDLQHLQALAQVADPAVDLAQLLLAVGVFGVLAAVALGRGGGQGLDHFRPAPAPELLELGAQALETGAGDDRRGLFSGRSPAGHRASLSSIRGSQMIPKPSAGQAWIIASGTSPEGTR